MSHIRKTPKDRLQLIDLLAAISLQCEKIIKFLIFIVLKKIAQHFFLEVDDNNLANTEHHTIRVIAHDQLFPERTSRFLDMYSILVMLHFYTKL